jgi:hypothetical protein
MDLPKWQTFAGLKISQAEFNQIPACPGICVFVDSPTLAGL